MTTYYSERNPFIHEIITFFVLPLNDKTKVPANLYNSKPIDGHCFGSLETALNYCKDLYHYSIIVEPGTYTEEITINSKDLSRVKIYGSKASSIEENEWAAGLFDQATPNEITKDNLNTQLVSVFTKGITFNKCTLPSLFNIYFNIDPNYTSERPPIFISKCTSNRSTIINFYINDPHLKVSDDRATLQFYQSTDIKIDNLICFSDRGVFVDTNSYVSCLRVVWIKSNTDYNTEAHNYTPPNILIVSSSRLDFDKELYNSRDKKILKNGRVLVTNSSKMIFSFFVRLLIDNKDYITKPDGTINKTKISSPIFLVEGFSNFIGETESKITFTGGNRPLEARDGSNITLYKLKFNTYYIDSCIFSLNGSRIRILDKLNLSNAEIKTFAVSKDLGSIIFAGEIFSEGLDTNSNKLLLFSAKNKSDIFFGPKSTFTGNKAGVFRGKFYTPDLNTGFDSFLSQIVKISSN